MHTNPKTKLNIFWDYDTQWGADASRSDAGPQSWGVRDFENTETLLEIHAKYGAPACFAVVGAAAVSGARPYHDPAQIRRIAEAGHEIASHSFRHEWLPGLTRASLLESLRASKDALEACTGMPVRAFVPPFNQPYDYPRGWSFSLSERKEAGPDRTDLGRLCECLAETGYEFCRVSYRPLGWRLLDQALGRRVPRVAQAETIAGIRCIRMNTSGGFDEPAQRVLRHCAGRNGYVLAYAHPHSLTTGSSQDQRHFEQFLEVAGSLKREGVLEFALPTLPAVLPVAGCWP